MDADRIARLQLELRTTTDVERKAAILAELDALGVKQTVVAPRKETR
jgi:hypothetical protein